MTLLQDLDRVRRDAAEEAVVASIPEELLARMRQADAEFAAKGGCPVCGSKSVGVHSGSCPVLANSIDL